MATVTIRYWAAAKHAAGIAEESISAESLSEVLDIACGKRNGNFRFSDVLACSSFLVDEKPVSRHAADLFILNDGMVIEVLPPFAGG